MFLRKNCPYSKGRMQSRDLEKNSYGVKLTHSSDLTIVQN
jgi:hypothetical protein